MIGDHLCQNGGVEQLHTQQNTKLQTDASLQLSLLRGLV